MIFNMVGGGAGGAGGGATLVVSSPTNVSVTVSKDDKSYTKNSGSLGSTIFRGLATGIWIVTISGNGQTATRTIEITADYAITIAFFSATINVTYPAGSTCIATDGVTTFTAPDATGTWTINVPNAGTWTVTATDGTDSDSIDVEITTEGQVESVELRYGLYLYDNGLIDGYTFGIAKDEGTATITYNDTDMFVHVGEYISFGVYCRQKIDVTDYSTVNISFENGDMSLASGRNMFGLSPATGYSDEDFTASVKFNNFSGSKTLSLDISSITGSYYVRFRGLTNQNGGSFDANITKIWLK